MQHTNPDIGTTFQTIENTPSNTFLSVLFKGATCKIPVREVTGLPVNQYGIALPDPTQTAEANWVVSCVITEHLVAALCQTDAFWSRDHSLLIGEGRDETLQWYAEAAEIAPGEARAVSSTEDTCMMGWIMRMWVWMSFLPSTVNGIKLGAQECRYSLFLHYGINLLDLPDHCNGCGATFYICHTLECNKGGLIMARHNELGDGFADLTSKYFNRTHVPDDPKIYTVHAVHGGKENIKGCPSKDK